MHPPRHFHLPLNKIWNQFGETEALSRIQVMPQEVLQKEKETFLMIGSQRWLHFGIIWGAFKIPDTLWATPTDLKYSVYLGYIPGTRILKKPPSQGGEPLISAPFHAQRNRKQSPILSWGSGGCVRLKNGPWRCSHPSLWNLWMLPGMAKGLCKGDQVKDLELQSLSWIVRWAWDVTAGVLWEGCRRSQKPHRRYVTRRQGTERKKCEHASLFAAFEDGGRGHKPKGVCSLWKLERSRKQILPWRLQKECSPWTHFQHLASITVRNKCGLF